MSFWRSRTVNCYQLILPRENAHRIVQQLGRLPDLSFRQTAPQATFAAQIKVIEEALMKLRLLQERLTAAEGVAFPMSYNKEQFEAFLEVADRSYRLQRRAEAHLLEAVLEEVAAMWDRQGLLTARLEELAEEAKMLREERSILRAGELLFGPRLYSRASGEEKGDERGISFKCAVVGKAEEAVLRRTLFRMTKGLSLYSSVDWSAGQGRSVFFLILGYGESRALSGKVQKLLDNYGIGSYAYPRTQEEMRQRVAGLDEREASNGRLSELVRQQLRESLHPLLEPQMADFPRLSRLEYCLLYLLTERKVFERLNQMRAHHHFYEAFLFVEPGKIEAVTSELQHRLRDDQMPSPQFIPVAAGDLPTLFTTNSVTRTPYEVLCAYGVPRYKEANPALLNLVTFPFLFGVMFGDVAHGAVLLALGLLLLLRPPQHPLLQLLHPHRHAIILMGFFSVYCGLIYNECLSLSLNLFGSCYRLEGGVAVREGECVYPVGVDPVWSISSNDLSFTNSLKMKMAVIIGVLHMAGGLAVKALNCWFLRRRAHILLEVLPQAAFLLALFGYMDFLIVYKWLHQWTPANAPSIITTMIDIPLHLGKTDECCGGQPLWGTYGNTSQDTIQFLLLMVAVGCVPAMFCLPLLHERLAQRRRRARESQLSLKDELSLGESMREREELLEKQGEEAGGEAAVLRLIETIEFVLGCISNTASYLRLWALSLAHSQLSLVFFDQTVQLGIERGFLGILYNLLLFPVYAGVSFGILVCMDAMECFLHTLRLHWVEFQTKFYKGDGREFASDDFRTYVNAHLHPQHQAHLQPQQAK